MSDILRIVQAVEFAALKHTYQRRKGANEEPYVNHLAAVAANVARATGGQDANLIIAAYLHDCIEDCAVPLGEIIEAFGDDVAKLVAAVTDDKSLPKDERKALQIKNAPHKPARAKLLKLADLVANMADMLAHPPVNWPLERQLKYFAWANDVVSGLRHGDPALDAPGLLAEFDALFARAESLKVGPMLHPLALAVKIAANAHATHQPDKGGAPYILHPLRMMMKMDSDEARIAAVLHDVIEDHADEGWTFERLGDLGIPEAVIEALRCVTKLADDEDYAAFIERAASNPIATQVKRADLEDNMNVLRLSELRDKDVERLRKYHQSWKRLS
jgi:(p)ppGpp synthase/HD superfamily hydrolase